MCGARQSNASAGRRSLAGKRFAQVTTCCIMCQLCPKQLPADVSRKLQHVVICACCVQNTCQQTFCASYSMLYYVPAVSKTPAGRRFAQVTACCSMCLVCPKHLPADVLSKLQHVVVCACCVQNACRQTFCVPFIFSSGLVCRFASTESMFYSAA